jgi:hypothetical protein
MRRTVLLMMPIAAVVAAQIPQRQSPQLAPFNSIEIVNSGHAVIRPGAAPQVTFVKGSADYTRIRVTNGGALVIDKCAVKCPRGYELELDIAVPGVTSISLANGGRIQTRGNFARQEELDVEVAHGGTIDVRTMLIDRVVARVNQGGRILTTPRVSLLATVQQGGNVTYWGNARVTSSVEHGGVVVKGSADELNEPLPELRVRRH